MTEVKNRKKTAFSALELLKNDDKDSGNILVLGIGIWFVVIALAFAIMAAADLYADKRDVAAEADYIALSLADDVDESSYYSGESDFRLSDSELARRATELARYDSEIVDVYSRSDGSIYVQLKRTVSLFAIPHFSDVRSVDLYASSTAYLREYRTP